MAASIKVVREQLLVRFKLVAVISDLQLPDKQAVITDSLQRNIEDTGDAVLRQHR